MFMKKTAGFLFFLGGGVVFMGIITAEIFYGSFYSISQSMISTLGSSPPPDSIIREPSAGIFDSAMILSGIAISIGAYLLRKTSEMKLTVAILLTGIGVAGVGFFPAFHAILHPISALLAFGAGGISALLASRNTLTPFSYVSLALGMVSLLFLFSGLFLSWLVVPVLGAGGAERWVAYPIMIWLIGFGGYLMNSTAVKK